MSVCRRQALTKRPKLFVREGELCKVKAVRVKTWHCRSQQMGKRHGVLVHVR